MASKKWRVRFSAFQPQAQSLDGQASEACERENPREVILRSRTGCLECRLRRVKCDETFPVCIRCAKRRSICTLPPRKSIWKIETPLARQAAPRTSTINATNMLQYWLERVCHVMALDPEANPLSSPILQWIGKSPALLHVIQSISVAHKTKFIGNSSDCLLERQKTLSHIQLELIEVRSCPLPAFLTIFLLGISTPWIEGTAGLEHLIGARKIIDVILADYTFSPSDPTIPIIMDLYLWWEMSSSFFLDSQAESPFQTDTLTKAVQMSKMQQHPLTGCALDLFYTIAQVNRYCRRIVDGCLRDVSVEACFEEEMLSWQADCQDEELCSLANAYRYHGLIQLRRICGPRSDFDNNIPDDMLCEDMHEGLIQHWAHLAIESLQRIPLSSSCLIFKAIPLLSAGSEIAVWQHEKRDDIRRRWEAIYSFSQLPVMQEALDLLEEVWEQRAMGITNSWLVVAQGRDRVFSLA